MKFSLWAILKGALIAAIAFQVLMLPVNSTRDAEALGATLAIATAFIAVFQTLYWFIFDVLTLKRGGWVLPRFTSNPFASRQGPAFHLDLLAIVLVIAGATKAISSLAQGTESLMLGIWLICIGLVLTFWQLFLRSLFRGRFQNQDGEPLRPANGG
jgi:hypothetical protein